MLSEELSEEDKFELSTPKQGAKAYIMALKENPKSYRIVHDIKQVLKSLEIVRAKKGVRCDEVANPSGRRREPVKEKRSGRGGKRKQAPDDYGLEVSQCPEIAKGVSVKLEKSRKRRIIVKNEGARA